MKSSGSHYALRNGGGGLSHEVGSSRLGSSGLRPRSPSHAAKNKTPEDRVCEFGWMLTQKEGRLMCRACNLNLDHTRRSTIVEHLRSRKHQRFLEESDLDVTTADASAVSPMVLMEICEDDNSQNNTQSSSDRPSSHSSPTSGMTGPYLLKKETHCSTILDQLLRDDTFSDVTLTAEGQSIKAHKIVLCLASAYFRQVLSKESSVQNVIVFRDIKFSELRNLINFIYTGEATVDAAELESFMRTAEMLEVNSLCEGHRTLPKNLIPKSKEAEPEKTKLSSGSSKRSHSSMVASPPMKTRRIVSTDSSPSSKISKVATYPSTSTEGGSVPPPTTSSATYPTCVIKSEPPSDEGEEREFCPRVDENKGLPETSMESPRHYEEPDQSPPLDRIDDLPEKVPLGKCPFCPNPQQQPSLFGSSLTNHVHLCHPEKTAFPCDICSRVFLKKRSFEAHKEDCVR